MDVDPYENAITVVKGHAEFHAGRVVEITVSTLSRVAGEEVWLFTPRFLRDRRGDSRIARPAGDEVCCLPILRSCP